MSGRPFGVLVVEDDVDLLSLMELVLSDAGYRVRTAPEGGPRSSASARRCPA